MKPILDDEDEDIKQHRVNAWNQRSGPRVGDFVELPDGTTRRFTHDWGDEIQTTGTAEFAGDASFYFGHGYMSFSGSLDPGVPKARLIDTGQIREGPAWFFHHDSACAHNGVSTTVPCRVYRLLPEGGSP